MSADLDSLIRERRELRRRLAVVTDEIASLRTQTRGTLPKLRRPTGKDVRSFYVQVADAYELALLRTHHPAAALADAAQVPVTTMHRWIREARRRGLLAPATRQGAAG